MVENLKRGIIPIYEPGLTPLVETHFKAGRLNFTTDAVAGVNHGQIQFIAVGTPPDEDGSADLQYVLAVASTIAQHMQDEKIIVDKSTVPVGTADKVTARIQSILDERGLSLSFDVVSNPTEGVYYIESLTNSLAQKALNLFKLIEKEGGYLKLLKKGVIQKKVQKL